jgi:RNA polymerase sigma-70 factor (ECF subfamily)
LIPSDELIQIHKRLLARDPTAPVDLAQVVLDPLLLSVRQKFANVDPALVHDSVVDAVLNYAERPTQYDPSKMSLMGYLAMSAKGDVLNALSALRRRTIREQSLDDVEVSGAVRKRLSKASMNQMTPADIAIDNLQGMRLLDRMRGAVQRPEDARIIQLMIDGERRTERFAAELGLVNATPAQQREAVKRHKDRIKKRLVRLEANSDE